MSFTADGAGARQLRMDPAVAESARTTIQTMSADLQRHAGAASSARTSIVAGAGEFADCLTGDVSISPDVEGP